MADTPQDLLHPEAFQEDATATVTTTTSSQNKQLLNQATDAMEVATDFELDEDEALTINEEMHGQQRRPYTRRNKFAPLIDEAQGLSVPELIQVRQKNLRLLVNFFGDGNITEFASKFGLTRSSVSLLLNGKIEFTTSYARKFSSCCGIPEYSMDMQDDEKLLNVLCKSVQQISAIMPPTVAKIVDDVPLSVEELRAKTKKAGRPRNNGVRKPKPVSPLVAAIQRKAVKNKASMYGAAVAPTVITPQLNPSQYGKTTITINGDQISGIFLEMLDVEASAGPGTYSNDYINSDQVFISDYEYYRYLSSETPSNLKVLKINGDSMEPVLKNGQTCVVRLVETYTNPGIYVFTYNNVTYIKRLMIANNRIIAVSENPHYPPFILEEETLIIHGKLVLALDYTRLA